MPTKRRPNKQYSKSGSPFDIEINVHVPCWIKRFHIIAKDKDFWKPFKIGQRTFVRTFQGLSEIKRMRTSEYYRDRDGFKWSPPDGWERII